MKVEGKNAVRELLKTETKIDKILAENSLRDGESRAILSEARAQGVRVESLAIVESMDENGLTFR